MQTKVVLPLPGQDLFEKLELCEMRVQLPLLCKFSARAAGKKPTIDLEIDMLSQQVPFTSSEINKVAVKEKKKKTITFF